MDHNPECGRSPICRACDGYGVLTINGGPRYRACPGEVEQRRLLAWHMDTISNEAADTPRWRLGVRRRLKREFDQTFRRYERLLPL